MMILFGSVFDVPTKTTLGCAVSDTNTCECELIYNGKSCQQNANTGDVECSSQSKHGF